MSGNTFGTLFRVTTFGESHGPALGCVIDGCPAGLPLDVETIRADLRRRRPGGGGPATTRVEADEPEILSGVFEGRTLGTPIAIILRNAGQRSGDYERLREVYRPGHGDWTWEAKYGLRDHRGGGRASARETAGRVAAGAVARAFLAAQGVVLRGWTAAAAGVAAPAPADPDFDEGAIETNPLRMPHPGAAARALSIIEDLRAAGDSAGCVVACLVRNLPPGLGEPVFDKLDARLAQAMLSLGAAKAVEFGDGRAVAAGRGSDLNDGLYPGDPVTWRTNHAGGVLGGLSTGAPLFFTVTFKPVPSIALPQATINRRGEPEELRVSGRHDVCVAPRAVPVVEAMTALTLADFLLLQRAAR